LDNVNKDIPKTSGKDASPMLLFRDPSHLLHFKLNPLGGAILPATKPMIIRGHFGVRDAQRVAMFFQECIQVRMAILTSVFIASHVEIPGNAFSKSKQMATDIHFAIPPVFGD
jgi:hypothetical protein